jgi:hypothetical protein
MNRHIYFKYSVLVAILALLSGGCGSLSGLSKEEKAAREAAVRGAIEKHEYIIDVDRMVPMKSGSKTLTSAYSVTIKGDSIISYLPYFGEAYNIPYGGGKALNFNAKITGYNQMFDGRGKAIIEIDTRNEEDQYHYFIEIFPNGSTSINVRSNNRQSISFYGTASEIKEKR